uniref:Epoxide hydrolase n=1 Tax=Electrophorus electricus TaxID=8005 RepID=A0A4W4DYC2_ELEEL
MKFSNCTKSNVWCPIFSLQPSNVFLSLDWPVGTALQRLHRHQIFIKTSLMPNASLDLHRRIGQTCSFPSLEDSKFHYGFNSRYLEQVVSYRRNNFHWLFFSIDVHYIYAKPKNLPEGARAMPLMMVHSWPGYFYKFCGVFLLLMEPMSPEHIAFEVVCSSISGYSFSECALLLCPGFDWVCAARVFHKTVKDLPTLGSLLLGRFFPKLFGFSERDITRIFPCVEKLVKDSVKESGYMQGTKPNTAGRGLNDSPVGLAAYILEKMSTWTDLEFRNLENGTGEFSLDDLLTNVVIYWPTGSIISSMWLYKENLVKGLAQPHQTILVLAGLAVFPCEVVYTLMSRGGHFIAMEEPELIAQELQKFVQIVQNRK